MKFDAYGASLRLEDTAPVACRVEELGFAGLWFTESQRPPFLSCAVASTVTSEIELGTAIAVAFPRSPMITAQNAWELAACEQRALLPRAGQSGEGPHRTSLLDALRTSGAEAPRVRPRAARDLARVPGRGTLAVRRRLLLVLAAHRLLRPRPERTSRHPGLDRGRERRYGPPRRRGLRRVPRAPVPLASVSRRGDRSRDRFGC